MHVKLGCDLVPAEDDVDTVADTAADTADYVDAHLCRFSRLLLLFYMRIILYAHYFICALYFTYVLFYFRICLYANRFIGS